MDCTLSGSIIAVRSSGRCYHKRPGLAFFSFSSIILLFFFSTLCQCFGGAKQTTLAYFSSSFQVLIFLFLLWIPKVVCSHQSSSFHRFASETRVPGLPHHLVLLLSIKTQWPNKATGHYCSPKMAGDLKSSLGQ